MHWHESIFVTYFNQIQCSCSGLGYVILTKMVIYTVYYHNYYQACYVTSDYENTKKKCDTDPASYSKVVDCTEFDLPEGAYQ